MRRRLLILLAVPAAASVLAAGFALSRTGAAPESHAAHDAAPTAGGSDTSNAMGADSERGGNPERGEVVIDPRRQQLIGVRLATVTRTALAQELRATGVVRFDETRQAEITTRVDGWIRELRADYTGRVVTRGEPLFTLYSPGLLAAQNEYLLALRGQSQASTSELPSVRDYSERLRAAARERLLRWDMTEADIRELEERGRATDTVTFRSPVGGTVVEKMAVEGMRVMAGETLFRVADLSVVWVEADVPEQDMSLVRVGQSANVLLDSFPNEPLVGRTVFVYPTVDEGTRTAKVRFQFANRNGRLKPGMFATVHLIGRDATALTVPADAVLDAGTDQIVFVALGEGRFAPRAVKVGRRMDDRIEVAGGLEEGEQVAAGAAFFLDSESQLRAAVRNYQPAPGDAPAGVTGPRLDISFRVQPDPPRAGENTFEVSVRDAEGQPVANADVTVTLFMPAMPSMNMPAMRSQAKLPPAGDGVYRGTADVMTPGRWDVTVDVGRDGQRLGSRQFAVVAR